MAVSIWRDLLNRWKINLGKSEPIWTIINSKKKTMGTYSSRIMTSAYLCDSIEVFSFFKNNISYCICCTIFAYPLLFSFFFSIFDLWLSSYMYLYKYSRNKELVISIIMDCRIYAFILIIAKWLLRCWQFSENDTVELYFVMLRKL
jgi:glycosyltransferase involved in cell wall biosynthesis